MEGGHCRCHWTEKEDDLLRIAVGIHGSSKWSLIKQLVGTKSGRKIFLLFFLFLHYFKILD